MSQDAEKGEPERQKVSVYISDPLNDRLVQDLKLALETKRQKIKIPSLRHFNRRFCLGRSRLSSE